jgi:hypothetical protein
VNGKRDLIPFRNLNNILSSLPFTPFRNDSPFLRIKVESKNRGSMIQEFKMKDHRKRTYESLRP